MMNRMGTAMTVGYVRSEPPADDEYGNLFCVSLRDSDHGSVWFWDHEQEAGDNQPPTESNLSTSTGRSPRRPGTPRPAAGRPGEAP